MAEWLPISPTLTGTGAFAALQNLPRASLLVPVPPDPTQPAFSYGTRSGSSSEVTAAMQLGVGAILDAKTSLQTRTLIHDFALSTQGIAQSNSPNGGLIYGTLWGAGVRARVDVINFTAKVSLNLDTIAAAASIGLVDAIYSIEGFGITDPAVLGMLPGPGRFDADMLKQLNAALDHVWHNCLTPKVGLTAVPYAILVAKPQITFGGPLTRAKAQLFAARQIAAGVPQDDAIKAGVLAGLDGLAVESAYTLWAGTTGSPPVPTPEGIRLAKTWLDRIDLH